MNTKELTLEELRALRVQMLTDAHNTGFIEGLYEYVMGMGFKHVRYPWSEDRLRLMVHRGVALFAREQYLGVKDNRMTMGKHLSIWSLQAGYKPAKLHTEAGQDELVHAQDLQLANCLIDEAGHVVTDHQYFISAGQWRADLESAAQNGRDEVARKWRNVREAEKAALISKLYPELK